MIGKQITSKIINQPNKLFMKKNLLFSAALSVLLFFGIGAPKAQAQEYYQAPPLNPELEVMAKQVVDLRLDDPEGANKVFAKLLKKIVGKTDDLLSVGTYFLKNNAYSAAVQCAKKIDDKLTAENVDICMFKAEVFMKGKKYGEAGVMYESALAIDSNYVPAIKRLGFVYKNINPSLAIDYLQKLQRIEPDNYNVDKEIGDIYYKQFESSDRDKQINRDLSIESYQAYYTRAPKDTTVLDFDACQKYVFALFLKQESPKVGELSSEMNSLWPNAMVFKRMRFLADVDTYDLDAAAEHISYIVNQEYPDSSYKYLDYFYAAKLNELNSELEPAIEYYKKALAVDSTQALAYKDLSNIYSQNQQAELGLETYKKYLEVIGDKADLSDKFFLGRRYVAVYQEPGVDPEKKQQCFDEANKIFAEVMEKKPDFIEVYIQCARLNNTDSSVANETVKNYYLKVIEMTAETPDEYKRQRLEASKYLFFYAINVEPNDLQLARRVLDIAAGINPNDKFVQQATKFMEMSN